MCEKIKLNDELLIHYRKIEKQCFILNMKTKEVIICRDAVFDFIRELKKNIDDNQNISEEEIKLLKEKGIIQYG